METFFGSRNIGLFYVSYYAFGLCAQIELHTESYTHTGTHTQSLLTHTHAVSHMSLLLCHVPRGVCVISAAHYSALGAREAEGV